MNTTLKIKEINFVGNNILLTGELLEGNLLIGNQLQNEEGLVIKIKGIALGLVKPLNTKNSKELTINIEYNKENRKKFELLKTSNKNVIFFSQ